MTPNLSINWCAALLVFFSAGVSAALLPEAPTEVEVQKTCSSVGLGAESDDVSLLQVITRQEARSGGHVAAKPVCSTSERLIRPGVASFASILPVLAFLAFCRARWDFAEYAHVVFTLNAGLVVFIFSATIVESYQLATALGRSVTWSGLSVGLSSGAMPVGNFAGWVVMNKFARCWSARVGMIVGCSCILAGGLLFTTVTLSVAGLAPYFHYRSAWLLVSRCFGGFGAGFLSQHSYTTAMVISSYEERPKRLVVMLLGVTLGIGLGPLAVAWISLFDTCRGQPPDYLTGGPLWLLLGLVALLAVLAYPSDQVEAIEQDAEQVKAVAAKEDRLVVVVTLVMSGLRAFVVAGLEVGTALLLEYRHGWPHGRIGAIIGVSFLTSIPVSVTYRNYYSGVPIATASRVLAIFVALGSLLLFDIWRPFGEAVTVATLVGGDVLLFPFLYLSDALMYGVRAQKVGPRGTAFDENAITLYFEAVTASARCFGPWLGRYFLENGGRSTYAMGQALCALIFVALAEGVVLPRVGRDRPDDEDLKKTRTP